ncbi:MAG: malonate decarboxylase acyl carrier protein [Pseudomonadota bacterium]|jgi:malonate decarboxylase delta subunit
MENLQFQFHGGHQQPAAAAQLVGVVSSGNLEVLLETCALGGQCEVQVVTAARGFAPVWQAVLRDFHARWQLRDVRLSINDMGATPAVVALRLDQVVQAALDREPT